jgi:phosphatidylserine/phosphatidylglycerophosphate/cardiolipin synthase-like enzyme
LLLAAACNSAGGDSENPGGGGKGDDPFAESRAVEIVLTEPFCDVCTAADKDFIRTRSPIIEAVLEAVAGAEETLEVAQYTFSVREIEDALLAAADRGVAIRIAIDRGQDRDGTVARRLAEAGLAVRFVSGKPRGGDRPPGLQHAKFLIADGDTLVTGSNNWSSTGTTINEENTAVISSSPEDPLIAGFACHFEVMWDSRPEDAIGCSSDLVAFTPGSAALGMLKDAIRGAERSVDVLMHHLVFDDLVTVLAQAAERGIAVRIVANHGDEGEHTGSRWDRLRAAGGAIRYKSSAPELFQLMHHKLAIVDDRVVINGSGNWSGSAFFNNYENFVRYADPAVVRRFRELFARLWDWSLDPASRQAGLTAAEQHAASTAIFFGNLHAHIAAAAGGVPLDDGRPVRQGEGGIDEPVPAAGGDVAGSARFAWEYARDSGGLDFLAISPHTTDERPEDPVTQANMTHEGYAALVEVARAVTAESSGSFVALPSMEWNTNSAGNHVGILGSEALAKVTRDRFDHLYQDFLPSRAHAGDIPLLQLNHPRTFPLHDGLAGSWDQIFEVILSEIEKNSERGRKFNDFGIDDFEPLVSVRQSWIDGLARPDPLVVAASLEAVREAAAPYARLMEVTLGRGTELGGEVAVNPSLVTDLETGEIVRRTRVHSDWDYYLLAGFELAPTAPHDNHMANWGTGHTSRTAVLAPTLAERAILGAIERRSLYASEDENLEVRLYAEDRVPMGSRLGTRADSVELTLSLADPDYAGEYQVRLISGMVGGSEVTIGEPVVVAAGATPLTLALPSRGRHFVYAEILEIGADRMAWSAPIWIDAL